MSQNSLTCFFCKKSSISGKNLFVFTQNSRAKKRWGFLNWIQQSFGLQEITGKLVVGKFWTHLCSMWSKVSNYYANHCQLFFQIFQIGVLLLYLYACILSPGVLWEHGAACHSTFFPWVKGDCSNTPSFCCPGTFCWRNPLLPCRVSHTVLVRLCAYCYIHKYMGT